MWLTLGDRTEHVTLELEKRGVVDPAVPGRGHPGHDRQCPSENDRFLAALAEVAAP